MRKTIPSACSCPQAFRFLGYCSHFYRADCSRRKGPRRVQLYAGGERRIPEDYRGTSLQDLQAQGEGQVYRQGLGQDAPRWQRPTRRKERLCGQYSRVISSSILLFIIDSKQQATKPTKPRPQENKTTRMPQNELLDLIFQCFREHKYWPFSALKARLNQPETYIKQTLEMVAHLVRSGDFAMTWELKPEAKESSYAMAYQNAKEELPPDPGYGMDEEEDGGAGSENEDVQFESVV